MLLDEVHIAKVRAVMQIFIWQRAPRTGDTRGKGLRGRSDAEEVHAPHRASGISPTIDVEQGQRDRHRRKPCLSRLIQRRIGGQPVCDR